MALSRFHLTRLRPAKQVPELLHPEPTVTGRGDPEMWRACLERQKGTATAQELP